MRRWYSILFLWLSSSLSIYSQSLFVSELYLQLDSAKAPFHFGVASGDPLPTQVVIWTKLVLSDDVFASVQWEISTDMNWQQITQQGSVLTDSSVGFTVKVDVKELDPGTQYYYRFNYQGKYSTTGVTKTVSTDVNSLKLAVMSCADLQMGYFNAYGHVAGRVDLDAILHLGDYIYEYPARAWPRRKSRRRSVRRFLPRHACRTLQDYRTRYAQYRLDPQLQAAHQQHPFIAVWDDHEISNNAHTATAPGSREQRRQQLARQAYFEWMPIRDHAKGQIYRDFSFGNLAHLWMLDERLAGRMPAATSLKDTSWYSPDRTMLGARQRRWLLHGMQHSQARWRLIGNQVVFSTLHDSRVFDRIAEAKLDRWDGYPAERDTILQFFQQNGFKNVVILTGDIHSTWAFDLTRNPYDTVEYSRRYSKAGLGAEFVTPSISSFNFDEVIPGILTAIAKKRFRRKKFNPHLRLVNLTKHGYMTLFLDREKAEVEWWYVRTLTRRKPTISSRKKRMLFWGEGRLR